MTILEAIAIIANHSFPDQRTADAAQVLIRRATAGTTAAIVTIEDFHSPYSVNDGIGTTIGERK